MATSSVSGGCHCGKVRFEAEADLDHVITCNCSICTKRGFIFTFVGKAAFRPLAGEDELKEYRFHRHAISHLFCPDCGVEAYARGTNPDGNEMVAINVRCLDDVDLAALKPQAYDGRAA